MSVRERVFSPPRPPGSNFCAAAGRVFDVIEGPVGADGYRWWRTTAGGWTADAYLTLAGSGDPAGAARSIADPFAFCSAVGTADWPVEEYQGAVRYVGPPQPFNRQVTSAGATYTEAVVWRCWAGRVFGCLAGGTAGACMKINRSSVPSQELIDYCRQNPNSTSFPFAVTGHGSQLYQWACRGTTPVIVAQNPMNDIDGLGYPIGPWFEVTR